MIERSLAAWQAHSRRTTCRARAGGKLCVRRVWCAGTPISWWPRPMVWPKCDAPCSVTPGPSAAAFRWYPPIGVGRYRLVASKFRHTITSRRAKPCVRRCASAPCGGRVIGRGATLALAGRPLAPAGLFLARHKPRQCAQAPMWRKQIPGNPYKRPSSSFCPSSFCPSSFSGTPSSNPVDHRGRRPRR